MNCPSDLFVQMSELHLFHSMLKLFRSMINVDSLIANQNSEVPQQVDPIQLQVKNLCSNPAKKVSAYGFSELWVLSTVFIFIYQFYSRIEALVSSSFEND